MNPDYLEEPLMKLYMCYRRKGRGYLNTQAHTSSHKCDMKRSISQSSTHKKNGSRQRMDSFP